MSLSTSAAHIFPSLSFAADVSVEAFLVAIQSTHQIQHPVGSVFPNHILVVLNRVSVFLLGDFFLLLFLVHLLSIFDFCLELLVHLWSSLTLLY